MQVGGSDVVVDGASCDGRTELVKAIQGQNAGVSAVLLCRSLLLKKCRMCHSYRLRVASSYYADTRVAVAGYGASRNLLGCIVHKTRESTTTIPQDSRIETHWFDDSRHPPRDLSLEKS